MLRKRKNLLIVIVFMIMALLVSACSGSGQPTATQTPTGTSGAGQATPASTPEQPVPITIMGNYNSPDLSESDQKFLRELEEFNNLEITLDIPPTTGYSERLQLMLASGSYPDLVFFPDTTNQSFQNAVNDGVIIPVNEYLESASNLLTHTYQASWDQLTINQDGNIYGIPRTSVIRNDAYWVRKDWLDNVGFDLPADNVVTLEQFEEILYKFTFEDPDRNGLNDTYGYGGAYNAQRVLDVIAPGAFGLTGWQPSASSGYDYMNPIYDRYDDSFKEALEYTSRLYTSGLFDPDSAVNDGTAQRERFWRGLTGVYPGFAGHYSWHTGEMQKNIPEAELEYLFIKDEQGEVKGGTLHTSSTGLWGFWAITTAAENPQKIVNYLDSILSDELWELTVYGYEGMDYILVDGEKAKPEESMGNFFRRNTMRRANDVGFFLSVEMSAGIIEMITPWLDKSIESVTPSLDSGYLPPAAQRPNYMDYSTRWDETIMRIIMGEEPISRFDELLDGWYRNGGEDYVSEMNEYISSMQN